MEFFYWEINQIVSLVAKGNLNARTVLFRFFFKLKDKKVYGLGYPIRNAYKMDAKVRLQTLKKTTTTITNKPINKMIKTN